MPPCRVAKYASFGDTTDTRVLPERPGEGLHALDALVRRAGALPGQPDHEIRNHSACPRPPAPAPVPHISRESAFMIMGAVHLGQAKRRDHACEEPDG